MESAPWEKMHEDTQTALKHLIDGQIALRARYKSHLVEVNKPEKKHRMTFALDGRLVGDIGELIAGEIFNLDLLGTRSKNVDAITEDQPAKKVQIKASLGDDSLSIKYGADYFLGIQLRPTGEFRIIYNGPAETVMNYLKMPKASGTNHSGRTNAGTRLEPISLGAWAVLNLDVPAEQRISRRQPLIPA